MKGTSVSLDLLLGVHLLEPERAKGLGECDASLQWQPLHLL